MEINKPVYIHWKDADTNSGWTAYQPEDADEVVLLPSIGFLTHITSEWAYLGFYTHKETDSKLCELRIPRENIRKIYPLKLPSKRAKFFTLEQYLEFVDG